MMIQQSCQSHIKPFLHERYAKIKHSFLSSKTSPFFFIHQLPQTKRGTTQIVPRSIDSSSSRRNTMFGTQVHIALQQDMPSQNSCYAWFSESTLYPCHALSVPNAVQSFRPSESRSATVCHAAHLQEQWTDISLAPSPHAAPTSQPQQNDTDSNIATIIMLIII